jgi:hypothetical protein
MPFSSRCSGGLEADEHLVSMGNRRGIDCGQLQHLRLTTTGQQYGLHRQNSLKLVLFVAADFIIAA